MQELVQRTSIQKLLQIAAAVVLGLALTSGVVMANDVSIDTAGVESDTTVDIESKLDVDVDHDNDVDLDNNTTQNAHTGDVKAKKNASTGDLTSGAAENDNDFDATIEIAGSHWFEDLCDCLLGGDNDVDVTNNGVKSDVKVNIEHKVELDYDVDNDVDVENNTTQNATSGYVKAYYNASTGNLTTGDASNTNSSSVHISL